MNELMKRVLVLLLMLVFILPASGIMVYVHKCNSRNSTLIDMSSEKSCCSKLNCTSSPKHDNQQASLNASACCIESNVLVKLTTNVLVHSLKVLNDDDLPFIPFINSDLDQYTVLTSKNKAYLDFDDYPPGSKTFILLSTFRI